MSITSGFYNSLNGDRKYDAMQLSSMFDGLIIDGVFASIGTAFTVKALNGLTITVGDGKAWFNHTWTINDSVLQLTAPDAESLLDRIDAVILEVNRMESVRANTIKIVKGVPSSSPSRPTLINTEDVHQYPLAYIYRKFGSLEIFQSDITPMVGSDETPFVTGVLRTISLNELLGKWQDELNKFVQNKSTEVANWIVTEENEFNDWFKQMKSDLVREQGLLDEWIATEQTDFTDWYNRMKDQLSTDAAGHLKLEVDKEEVKRTLLIGFVDGDKIFSEDGKTITSTSSDGRIMVKTFTNDFQTMTIVLKKSSGLEIARLVKNFDTNGITLNTSIIFN